MLAIYHSLAGFNNRRGLVVFFIGQIIFVKVHTVYSRLVSYLIVLWLGIAAISKAEPKGFVRQSQDFRQMYINIEKIISY